MSISVLVGSRRPQERGAGGVICPAWLTRLDEVVEGDGYAVANVDALAEGPGFRKVRRLLGVTAFGVNAIELPPGFETGRHFHDEQEELYFVHRGRIRIRLNDETEHVLGPGGLARVDAADRAPDQERGRRAAVYLIAGGKDGYVGRDGRLPEGETSRFGAAGNPGRACSARWPSAQPPGRLPGLPGRQPLEPARRQAAGAAELGRHRALDRRGEHMHADFGSGNYQGADRHPVRHRPARPAARTGLVRLRG